jgi:hypothetical protein
MVLMVSYFGGGPISIWAAPPKEEKASEIALCHGDAYLGSGLDGLLPKSGFMYEPSLK